MKHSLGTKSAQKLPGILQVVAPVRESCAQALGVVAKFMHEESVSKLLVVLIELLTQPHWEVRHGGLLGIKYLLVVRKVILPNWLSLKPIRMCVFFVSSSS